MNEIKQLLENVKYGSISVDEAILKLKIAPFEDIGFAKVDLHRSMRQGVAEVIYGAGKTSEQIFSISQTLLNNSEKAVLITRLSKLRLRRRFLGTVLIDYMSSVSPGFTVCFRIWTRL